MSKTGLALCTLAKRPIHGLRHKPESGTNGWYFWCGDQLLAKDEFFSPLHIEHLAEYLPEVGPYLSLPPGYRILIDGAGYEDVWFDSALLLD